VQYPEIVRKTHMVQILIIREKSERMSNSASTTRCVVLLDIVKNRSYDELCPTVYHGLSPKYQKNIGNKPIFGLIYLFQSYPQRTISRYHRSRI
jgi:hypothetical protein